MNNETVSYRRKDIIKVLKHLNMIVVSLDRIGSKYSEHEGRKSDEELNALLADFIFDWNVCEKLANVRKILDTAFSRELDDNEMDELEREFQGLQYWSRNNPKPLKKRK